MSMTFNQYCGAITFRKKGINTVVIEVKDSVLLELEPEEMQAIIGWFQQVLDDRKTLRENSK